MKIAETPKNWFALEITTNAQASEAVEFALNELDALGTEINNLGLKAAESLTVIGYFNEKPDDENIKFQVSDSLRIYGFSDDLIKKTAWREVENADWLAEWKKHWKPTVTERFIIAPPWENVENSGKIVIRIEPNMAFGTGTHETTRLCLKAIEENYNASETFFDVGTGTGILAIAAAKLQNEDSESKIEGCDTDRDSIKIAVENAELNQTPDINFYVGSLPADSSKFDFVCANLTADVIVPLLPLLVEKAKRILVLSGILKTQEVSVLEELDKYNVEKPRVETLGEWISVTVQNL